MGATATKDEGVDGFCPEEPGGESSEVEVTSHAGDQEAEEAVPAVLSPVSLDRASWQALLSHMSFKSMSKLRLGMLLHDLILQAPMQIGHFVRTLNEAMPLQGERQRDILPLPLPSLEYLYKWRQKLFVSNRCRQQKASLAALACESVWMWLVVVGLNFEFFGGHYTNVYQSGAKASACQLVALDHLRASVAYFCQQPIFEHVLPDFRSLAGAKLSSYSGEAAVPVLPLVPLEIEPGLPKRGVAGSVEAIHLCHPEVQAWLADADSSLLPRDSWPSKVPKAKVHVRNDSEWEQVALILYDRGICELCDISEAFHVNGQAVTIGGFGVEKKGTPGPGQVRVTRVIMNMIPTNAYQRMLRSDLSTLTPSAHWGGIVIAKGHVLLWSGDDQKGAYYVFRLPHCWRKYMVFSKPVRGSVFGSPKEFVWLCVRVIPMGWLSAVSLFQHIHRRLGLAPEPLGAGFPVSAEFRRDAKIPTNYAGECEWVQYYLDDFDAPEIMEESRARALAHSVSSNQLRQREAYKRQGVSIFRR